MGYDDSVDYCDHSARACVGVCVFVERPIERVGRAHP